MIICIDRKVRLSGHHTFVKKRVLKEIQKTHLIGLFFRVMVVVITVVVEIMVLVVVVIIVMAAVLLVFVGGGC